MSKLTDWICTVVVTAFFLLIAFGGIASCVPRHAARGVVTDAGITRAAASVVRVRVFCNGELTGFGSGVIISPLHVLTARHIADACEDTDTPDMGTFEVVTMSGYTYNMTADRVAENEDIDAARLVSDGPDFHAWAEISHALPVRSDGETFGAPVFMITGDGANMQDPDGYPWFLKYGTLSTHTHAKFGVSMHAVPGNSGGAVFDADGRVVGILWGGVWHPAKENYFEASRPSAWVDLIPAPASVIF